MRKAQKEQATKLVATISQVHEEIRKYLELHNTTMALELLAQCQQGAIELGGFIEKFEGEGCATVRVLEEYCEYVYNTHEEISQAISSNQTVNENKIYKNLRKRLIQIENSIKNEIPERKEVVFFPYKASMWDSLESVYLAARKDPNCDAYCVPIPYYDLKPDRSFGEMHYEGGQYPKNIGITDWQAYNFEERNPDEIYIHNPYDDWNLVTSVHPRFYSKNLKEHTEKLIYIPYFVLGEIEPDNQQAIDGMKHFIWLPGVINADKVIVQSEKMKQIYVNEYLKSAQANGLGGNHLNRSYMEQKILGLGSPKFDKVNNTKKEDLEIPEDWLKIIEKPDGSWKKIIFYNTSVGALLSNSEKMFDKMRYVFGVFKENQDEVALLWRPHPLIENTVKSMRPQLWEQYKALVEEYKREGWGIYDDSSDMDRAVILSDGYYGDGSSIVQLYQQTGKPVMLQNVQVVANRNNYSVAFDNILNYDDKLLFLNMVDDSLYLMDKYVENVNLLKVLPREIDSAYEPMYLKIALYDMKVFMIPFSSKKICVYDIEKDDIRYIDYCAESAYRGQIFADYVVRDNILYLIPCAFPYIVRVDMEKEKAICIKERISKNKLLSEENKINYAFASIWENGNKIYFTKLTGNEVIEFDISEEKYSIYHSEKLNNGCVGICGDDLNVWIVPKKNDKLIRWDRAKKEIYDITIFPSGFISGKLSVHKIINTSKYIYLLPREANMCLQVDKTNCSIREVNIDLVEERYSYFQRYMQISNIIKINNKTYIFASSGVYVFDEDENKSRKLQLSIEVNIKNMISNVKGIIYERESYLQDTQGYIDYICAEV